MPRNGYYEKKKGVAQTVPFTKTIGTTQTVNSQSIIVLEKDSAGNILRCKGTVSITGGGAGYAKGCLYIKTDASGDGLYRNVGSTSSCTFEALDTISASEIALADGTILIGTAGGVGAAKTPSGDMTMNREGVVTVDPALIQRTTVTVATADVLTANGTPIVLVPAVAGKAIVVESITATINYNSVAYATNTTMEFSYTTATTKVTADITALLNATTDKVVKVGGIEAALVCAINDAVQMKVATGNPTAGDSPITITTAYRLVTAA